ncbi:MAG: hypothetical protein HKP27_12270 [Myxococcales bacterium]|nr:hypothetical protein [Myxococcales bacterium]
MLRAMRQGQRWLLWLVIIGVGGVFAFTFGVGGSFSPQAGASDAVFVAGRSFKVNDFDRLRQNQVRAYREQYGDAVEQFVDSGRFEQMAADSLVRMGVLASEAERLGITVSDAEVRDYLRNALGGGQALDRDAVTQFAQREYGSLRRLQEQLRDELLSMKLSRVLRQSVSVSDAEVRNALRYAEQEISIAWVGFDQSKPPEGQEVSEEELSAFIEKNAARIKESYEARIDSFDLPERVRASHILLTAPSGDDERAAVRERIAAVRARIVGGEDFAAVAREVSEDPGSKERGGELGEFQRGTMVPAFDEVAFSIEPGVLSEPVESDFGFHLIRVDEKLPAKLVPLEEAQESIARGLASFDRARELAESKSAELLEDVRAGKSLTDATRERGYTLERPGPIKRNGYIDGLGAAVELVEALFQHGKTGSLARVFDVASQKVLVEILDRRVPTDAELTASIEATKAQMLEDRRNAFEMAWIDRRRQELADVGQLYVNPEILEP